MRETARAPDRAQRKPRRRAIIARARQPSSILWCADPAPRWAPIIQEHGRRLRCCDRRDRGRTHRNSEGDSEAECQARHCHGRRRRAPPYGTRQPAPGCRFEKRHAPATCGPASDGSRRTDCVADPCFRTQPSLRLPSEVRCPAKQGQWNRRPCYVRSRRPQYRCDRETAAPRPATRDRLLRFRRWARPKNDHSSGVVRPERHHLF